MLIDVQTWVMPPAPVVLTGLSGPLAVMCSCGHRNISHHYRAPHQCVYCPCDHFKPPPGDVYEREGP